MCIIVAKKKGVDFPTWKTLETCFNCNPDGAGFMWNDADGNVRIEKGFMTFGRFKKALKVAKRQMTNDTSVVMHFRIMTHGEISQECCHPFPLEGKLDKLRKVECSAKYGVAHNGIINGRKTNTKKSDTMDYILQVLYPLSKISSDIIDNKYVSNIIEDTLGGSRLAILDGNGNIGLSGSWVYDNGVAYSNTTYKQVSYGYLTSGYGYYDAWDFNDYSSGYFYDAKAAEKYGFGAVEEDNGDWIEDYEDDEKTFAKTMREGYPCYRCSERDDCVREQHWFCENENEANLFVDWFEGEHNYGNIE